jgi:hypothetical protein
MEQARRRSGNFLVLGYEESRPSSKTSKVFAKPEGYRPPSVLPEDDQLDWEIEIALEFQMRALKPLLQLPADRFRQAS